MSAPATDTSIATLDLLFRVSDRLFKRALDGADPALLRRRPWDGANCMLWIAGHATRTRAALLDLLGRPHPIAWSGLFKRGGTNDREHEWPDIAEIVSTWDAVSTALHARIAELTPAELDAEAGDLPSLDGTRRGAIALMAFHDSYHIGQLGLLRRMSGLERIAG